jgi:peptide/nickel transport system ATP-binding protein
MAMEKNDVLVKVENLKKYFPIYGGILQKVVGYIYAVEDASFYIRKGETLGLVGESGSGKTTVGRILVKLEEPTGGKIFYNGSDVTNIKGSELKKYRRKAQIIFQDPYASLNPRMTIKDSIIEVMRVHHLHKGEEYNNALRLMEKVGLSEEHLYRFPHELSGGQRQRAVIARALAVEPEFLILDEPTASLDVSVQAQVLDLLKELQEKYNYTYLLITHNLAVVRYVSERTVIMYRGMWVETSRTKELFNKAEHPYTQALLKSVPIPDPEVKKDKFLISGEPPNPTTPVKGCPFADRCPYVMDVCKNEMPPIENVGDEHKVRCWLVTRK